MSKKLTCLKDYQNRIKQQLGAYLDISKWTAYTIDAGLREALRAANQHIEPLEVKLDVAQGLDENGCPIPNTGVIDVSELCYFDICAVATRNSSGQCCFDSSQVNFRTSLDDKLYLGCCSCIGTTVCIRYTPILCICDLDGATETDHNVPSRYADTIAKGAIAYALRIRARQLSESRNEQDKAKQESTHAKTLLDMAQLYLEEFEEMCVRQSMPQETIVWNIDIGDRQCKDMKLC